MLDTVWENTFYLNSKSLMYMNPGRFGLGNIRRVNAGLMKDRGMNRASVAEFDEIDGLTWVEKEEQIRRRYEILRELLKAWGLERARYYPYAQNLIFWCSRQAGGKEAVRRLYADYLGKLLSEYARDRITAHAPPGGN
jgi:hypothetical protein